MATRKKDPRFNDLIRELEAVLARLEDDEVTLEDSLEAFEKGIGLTRAAQKLLSEAEQRVALLTESAEGDPVEQALDDQDLP
jgi:exodeoxyribonuclease VII small subunit